MEGQERCPELVDWNPDIVDAFEELSRCSNLNQFWPAQGWRNHSFFIRTIRLWNIGAVLSQEDEEGQDSSNSQQIGVFVVICIQSANSLSDSGVYKLNRLKSLQNSYVNFTMRVLLEVLLNKNYLNSITL